MTSDQDAASTALEAVIRYRDGSDGPDEAAHAVMALAQFGKDEFCQMSTDFVGLVATLGRDLERPSVLAAAELLEDLCVEQGALRALAFLSWRRGRVEEAAERQARALRAPSWTNDGMERRLADGMNRTSRGRSAT